MKYLVTTGLVLTVLGLVWTGQAQAECKVLASDPTYTAGQLKDLTCNESGQLQVEVVTGGAGGLGIANAAAPTLTEAAVGYFSWDLAGNLRTTLGTLLSGEDQTNNLLMTSGGVVRGTEGNIINSAVGDATSAAFQLPTGSKSFTARITGAGAVAQTITIYGGTSSSMAAATSEVLCTINLNGTSGAAGTAAMCNPITAAILYYKVVTSASSGTPTTILTANY